VTLIAAQAAFLNYAARATTNHQSSEYALTRTLRTTSAEILKGKKRKEENLYTSVDGDVECFCRPLHTDLQIGENKKIKKQEKDGGLL
jgi:hypothetical protein